MAMSGMMAFMIMLAGTSLVAYVLMPGNANRRVRRTGASDGAPNSTSDSGGDSEGFGWFSSSSDPDHSVSCASDAPSSDAGGD